MGASHLNRSSTGRKQAVLFFATAVVTVVVGAVLLHGAIPTASPEYISEIRRLGDRANSPLREAWFPAAERLGELAAMNVASRAQVWELARVNTLGMKFVEVPAGAFYFRPSGSRLGMRRWTKVERPFYICVTETTNTQYTTLTPAFKPDPKYSPDPDSPAVNIDWDEAVEFCERLSRREGVTYRLPTEVEWEYACKAGTGKRWCFGQSSGLLADYVWNDRGLGRAQRVALLKPNAWGIFDMHGNVGEFALESPHDEKPNPRPMIRGGTWHSARYACSCTVRNPRPIFRRVPFSSDISWTSEVGFRVVRELGKVE